MQKAVYVYVLGSKSLTLYIGVTNNLERRMYEHKEKINKGFTARYNIDRLLYYETGDDFSVAIAREKQLKKYSRKRKLDLIESINPSYKDLSEGWFDADYYGL